MLLKYFEKSFDGMRGENKFMRIAVAALIILLFAQHCSTSNKSEIITVVPPTLAEKSWLSETQASAEYVESWAMYVSMLLGNVNPANADVAKDAIGQLLSPDIFQNVMTVMDDQIHKIRQDRVSMNFEPEKILRDGVQSDLFYVTGRSISEGPTGDKTRVNRTYEVRVMMKNYRPSVTWVQTYTGSPRTPDVIEKEKALEERRARVRD